MSLKDCQTLQKSEAARYNTIRARFESTQHLRSAICVPCANTCQDAALSASFPQKPSPPNVYRIFLSADQKLSASTGVTARGICHAKTPGKIARTSTLPIHPSNARLIPPTTNTTPRTRFLMWKASSSSFLAILRWCEW